MRFRLLRGVLLGAAEFSPLSKWASARFPGDLQRRRLGLRWEERRWMPKQGRRLHKKSHRSPQFIWGWVKTLVPREPQNSW